jgi:hypothetical protein
MARALFLCLSSSSLLFAAGCMSHTRSDTDAAVSPDSPVPFASDGCPGYDGCGWTPPIGVCRDQDARGEGPCEAEIGFVWRSGACWSISGCSCVGADCGSLPTTAEECITAHLACERVCGGRAQAEGCLESEFCDYPSGSFCGGDDSSGVCTPRPIDCPDPGGVPVCGCDGNEYLTECSAYLVGTDIRELGPCVATSAYDTARADRDCAPADGPAWRITLTTERASCDVEPTDGSIVLSLWHALETEAPGSSYELGADFASDGQALICGRPGEPCATATGTFSFSVFAVGEVARFDFDVRTADGRRFAERDVEIARWWCGLTSPGCG